jgi:hypothetical protein
VGVDEHELDRARTEQRGIPNGKMVLSYGALPAGRSITAWIYFQVNPTNVGKRRENVAITDGSTPLAELHRSLTIFP